MRPLPTLEFRIEQAERTPGGCDEGVPDGWGPDLTGEVYQAEPPFPDQAV
ncbi:MAG: hypothetical protein ABSB23_22005 [Bryobacteraceae bacterium]|jgi:hypothetical protein